MIPPAAADTSRSLAASASFDALIPVYCELTVSTVWPARLVHFPLLVQVCGCPSGPMVTGWPPPIVRVTPLPPEGGRGRGAGHGHIGAHPVQGAEHLGLRLVHPGRRGGHDDHQPDSQRQAQRDENGLTYPAAKLPPQVRDIEHLR
jgi:hypothetical protein